MKPKQTYLVLSARGTGWEAFGPLALEFRTLKEAEAAAHDLSARFPQRTVGVYELRSVFGTQQKVVKRKVEVSVPDEKLEISESSGENVVALRTTK